MTDLSCEQLDSISAELVLGLLPGHQRAEALAHLTACVHCREQVRQLTAVSEGLLSLVPGIEPPLGCESRIMERLALGPPRSRLYRWRRVLIGTAAAVSLAGIGFGGWTIGAASQAPPPVAAPVAHQGSTTVAMQALTSPDRRHVGQLYVYSGDTPWVYLMVDTEGTNGPVTCQLQRKDGTYTTVGSFQLDKGYGSWGGPTGLDPGQLTGARLIDVHGKTVATAPLAASG